MMTRQQRTGPGADLCGIGGLERSDSYDCDKPGKRAGQEGKIECNE